MNDIELAFKIDSTVGFNYEKAHTIRNLYKGAEVQYIRRALEALIINTLNEFQEAITPNLYENIETLSRSKLISSDIIFLCHTVRRECNQQLHFTPNFNELNSTKDNCAFDTFEKLICLYYISLGGKLIDYEKSKITENDIQASLKKIYLEEELSSEQILRVAMYWFEKHRGKRENGTSKVTSIGTPFFLDSAVTLVRQVLRNTNDALFDLSVTLYLIILREPVFIDNNYEEIYRYVKYKTEKGDYQSLDALIDVTIYTDHLIPEAAEMLKLAFESGTSLSLKSLIAIYCYYNGVNEKFSSLVTGNISIARDALLQAVNHEDADHSVFQIYAFDLYQGITVEQDFKKAFDILDKLASLNPVVAKETKSTLLGMFESGHIEIKKYKTETPFISNKLGRNDICLCGSGKKFKKCCLK